MRHGLVMAAYPRFTQPLGPFSLLAGCRSFCVFYSCGLFFLHRNLNARCQFFMNPMLGYFVHSTVPRHCEK